MLPPSARRDSTKTIAASMRVGWRVLSVPWDENQRAGLSVVCELVAICVGDKRVDAALEAWAEQQAAQGTPVCARRHRGDHEPGR